MLSIATALRKCHRCKSSGVDPAVAITYVQGPGFQGVTTPVLGHGGGDDSREVCTKKPI